MSSAQNTRFTRRDSPKQGTLLNIPEYSESLLKQFPVSSPNLLLYPSDQLLRRVLFVRTEAQKPGCLGRK